jgi:membrane-bound serine protease (ClpP class)
LFWAVFLFIIGVVLIVAEFVLPGLICGITAVACLIASTVIGIKAYPEYTVFIIVGESIGAFAGVVAGLFVLAKTPVGRSLFLDTVQTDEAGYTNMKSDTSLIGTTGVVLTALRPSGTIEVNGKRIDAVSDGSFIGEGSLVQVAEVHGNRVVVEAADAAEAR